MNFKIKSGSSMGEVLYREYFCSKMAFENWGQKNFDLR